MDNTAIEEIQKGAAAIAVQKVVDAKAEHPAVLQPKGYFIQSLEAHRKHKDRFTGTYETHSRDDFIAYCIDTKHVAQKVFVDGDTFRACAYFDLGTTAAPGHAKHCAVLALQNSAAWKALNEFTGRSLSQQDAAEAVEDWADHFEAFDAKGQLIDKAQTVTAFRNVTIESYRKSEHVKENLSASRSLIETVEASSEHELPSTLYFTCAPHLNTAVRRCMLRVAVHVKGDSLYIKFRDASRDQMIETMGIDFAAELADLLKEKSRVFIGTFCV